MVALDETAAMSAGSEFIFVRIGRDDSGAARWQTINQPSVGRNSEHSNADRTLARRCCRSNAFLFAAGRARLTRRGRLCSLGAFRGRRSSLVRTGAFQNRARRSGCDSIRVCGDPGLPIRCLGLLKVRGRGLRGVRNCSAIGRWLVRESHSCICALR